MQAIYKLFFQFLFLFISFNAMAGSAIILNHNFESDVIPLDPGYTTNISGWVSNGVGTLGVNAPIGSNIHYDSVAAQVQVAYLEAGARLGQVTNLLLTQGKTYTLTFDAGQRLDQTGLNMVARIKVDGLVLAQIHSNEFTIDAGKWSSETLTLKATGEMPIGKPIVVEFQNVAGGTGYQANIDNVMLEEDEGTSESILSEHVSLIYHDTTLLVPFIFSDINSALHYLKDKRIAVGKTVTIQVDDCSAQTYSQAIYVNHSNGEQIQILGNISNPEDCVLQFNGGHGVVVADSNVLGLIDGFTLQGGQTHNANGLYALNGGLINSGANMIISEFGNGVIAENNASIFVDDSVAHKGILAENNIDKGLYAKDRGMVYARYAKAQYNGVGVVSENNSYVDAYHANASDNSGDGFLAVNGSSFWGAGASTVAERNGKTGFSSKQNAFIYAHSAQSISNLGVGFSATEHAYMRAEKSTSSGNSEAYSPALGALGNNNAYMDN